MYRLILDYDITITRMNNLHFKKKKKITHDIRIVYFAQKYDLMLYIFVNYIHIKLIYMQKFAYVKLYNIYI